MAYKCEIIADSINKLGTRITTFQITFPRSVLAEYNTHRKCSKNSASSRAIPVEKMIKMVETDPYIPIFTKNQSGMQGIDASDDNEFQEKATGLWLSGRDKALQTAKDMLNSGIHKQDANRVLEPWLWHTVVTTSTSWANFFALRVHPMAHPAIQTIATMMADAMVENEPRFLENSRHHLPYITAQDRVDVLERLKPRVFASEYWSLLIKMSVARCARVSYMRQNAITTIEEDIALHDRLVGSDPKHSSAAEHQARADCYVNQSGNFHGGWVQYRHTLPNESAKEFVWKGHIIK